MRDAAPVPMTGLAPVWFLRHGETEWNAARRVQGQMEAQLSPRGRDHALAQRALIAPVLDSAPRILVSPLIRAQQTARIALDGAPFQTDPRLMEIHCGDWQGLYYDNIFARWPDRVQPGCAALDLFAAAPGGEGLDAFTSRVRGVLDGLDGPTVIVGHGLWGQVARGLVRGLDAAGTAALDNRQGVVYRLEAGREILLD